MNSLSNGGKCCFHTTVLWTTFYESSAIVGRLCEKALVEKFCFHAIGHPTASQLFKQGRSVVKEKELDGVAGF
jgi:hypothetical protein